MIYIGDLQRMAELYEAPYRQNGYHGDVGGVSPVVCCVGTVPVLVSAPHATVQWRDGRFKEQDDYTGAIAHLVQRYTDCSLIASARFSVEDPNYCEGGYYKKRLEALVRAHDIRFVIDLHGASDAHEFDIDFGTAHGESMTPERLAEAEAAFRAYGFADVRADSAFPAAHPRTVSRFAAAELEVPSVQMELNKRLRSPDGNPAGFWAAVHALIDLVHLWGGGDSGHEAPRELERRGDQLGASAGD